MPATRPHIPPATRPLDDRARAALFPVLAQAFSRFSPRVVQLFSETDLPGTRDQWAVAAPLVALRHFGPLEVEAVDVDEAVDFVTEGWKTIHANRPALIGKAGPASQRDLESCRDTGAILGVRDDDGLVALAAARKGVRIGLGEAEVVEEVVLPRAQGRRLGASLQIALAHHVPLEGLLWGTIDAANPWSLAAAKRAGRRPIGSWWFLEL